MRAGISGSQSATFRVAPSTIADLDRVLAIEEQSFSAPWSRKMFEVELTGNPFGHLWGSWVRDTSNNEVREATSKVHDARNNERHACGRGRDGEAAVSLPHSCARDGERPVSCALDTEAAGDSSEKLVGYICFWVVFEEFRLMTLAVESEWRRRGIARGLMNQALTWATAAGARRALLEVRASNTAAIQLYERAGFRTVAVRERYYTNPVENALIMTMEPIR
jgi:ribosomal-protein-alanine acetyltransferase